MSSVEDFFLEFYNFDKIVMEKEGNVKVLALCLSEAS